MNSPLYCTFLTRHRKSVDEGYIFHCGRDHFLQKRIAGSMDSLRQS